MGAMTFATCQNPITQKWFELDFYFIYTQSEGCLSMSITHLVQDRGACVLVVNSDECLLLLSLKLPDDVQVLFVVVHAHHLALEEQLAVLHELTQDPVIQ